METVDFTVFTPKQGLVGERRGGETRMLWPFNTSEPYG